MKPRRPDDTGLVDRGDIRIHWERHGDGERTVVLVPTWSLFPADHWKLQVPYLARRYRVLVVEGRGRGRSGTPQDAAGFAIDEYVADIVAVLDATGTDRAALIGLSRGALWALGAAATHPDRVESVVAIGPAVPLGDMVARDRIVFEAEPAAPLEALEGWDRYNARYWQHGYAQFVDFFVDTMFPEPHSTKAREDGKAWGAAADVTMMISATRDAHVPDDEWFRSVVGFVRCPVLVIHGGDDRIRPHSAGRRLAEVTGGSLVTLAGSGHAPHLRDPVFVNLTIHEFLRQRSHVPR